MSKGFTRAIAAVLMSSCAAFGQEVLWTGGGDGRSWSDRSNWEGNAVPAQGSDVRFPRLPASGPYVEYDVEVDDTALDDFRAVHSINSELNGSGRVVIDTDSDFSLGVKMGGVAVIKRGQSKMTLAENDSHDYYSMRLKIEAGSVQLATNRCRTANSPYYYGDVIVGQSATLFLGHASETASWPANCKCVFRTLNSAGLVTNDTGIALYVGVTANSGSVISGPIGGNADLRFIPYGSMAITSTNNAFGGQIAPFTSVDPVRFGIAKIGMTSDARSSIGRVQDLYFTDYGGLFEYLGTDGETTDKWYVFADSNVTPVGWDAGAYGGVIFRGPWMTSSKDKMKRMVLLGSNTVNACVLDNTFYSVDSNADDGIDYSVYITKKGTGIWRFNDNAKRYNDGVIAVEEGTLQYETIAPKGVMCSLGRASALHQDYDGAYDATKDVTYAYVLGGGASEARFEYVGSSAATCTDRPFVLRGDATVSSTRAPLTLGGFTSADGLPHQLTLEGGPETDGSSIRDVTGRVSVVKSGAGKWTLAGDVGFTGALEVREGTLELSAPQYQWYRLTVTKNWGCRIGNNNAGWLCMQEVALYDSDGVRRNVGLNPYPALADLYTDYPATDTDWGDRVPYVDPNTIMIGRNGRMYVQDKNCYVQSLVDDSITSQEYWATYYGFNAYMQRPSDENPYVFVMRLPVGAPPIVAYDICASANSARTNHFPCTFTMEASANGVNWDRLHAASNVTIPEAGCWYSDGSAFSAGATRPNAGYPLATPPVAKNALENVTAVSVAKGARLVNNGAAAEVSYLRLDACEGAGTFAGLTFANAGIIELNDCPNGIFDVQVSFEGCNQNVLSGWTLKVDGKIRPSYRVVVTVGGLKIQPGGMMMIVR